MQQGETIRPAEKPLAFVPGLHTWEEGLGTASGTKLLPLGSAQGLCKLLFWKPCHFSDDID